MRRSRPAKRARADVAGPRPTRDARRGAGGGGSRRMRLRLKAGGIERRRMSEIADHKENKVPRRVISRERLEAVLNLSSSGVAQVVDLK
eukprot:2165032-Pleurochrysis_carterae.AAC.1